MCNRRIFVQMAVQGVDEGSGRQEMSSGFELCLRAVDFRFLIHFPSLEQAVHQRKSISRIERLVDITRCDSQRYSIYPSLTHTYIQSLNEWEIPVELFRAPLSVAHQN